MPTKIWIAALAVAAAACVHHEQDVIPIDGDVGGDMRIGPVPGEFVWAHGVGTELDDAGAHALAMPDGGFVTAFDLAYAPQAPSPSTADVGCGTIPLAHNGTGVLARYTADGTCMWSRSFAGTGRSGAGAPLRLPDGDVVVNGLFYGQIDLGTGSLDGGTDGAPYIERFSPDDGHAVWAKVVIGPADLRGLAVDGSGDLYVSGSLCPGGRATTFTLDGISVACQSYAILLARLDGSGTARWAEVLGDADGGATPGDLQAVPGGGVVMTVGAPGAVDLGTGPLAPVSLNDSILAAFDGQGHARWARREDVGYYSVAIGQDGTVAIGGFWNGAGSTVGGLPITPPPAQTQPGGIFVALLGPDGAGRWARGLDTKQALAVGRDPHDGVLALGSTAVLDGTPFDHAAFVATFADADGTTGIARAYPGGWGQVYGASWDPDGAIILTGGYAKTTAGQLDLGGGPLHDFGDADVFFAKVRYP